MINKKYLNLLRSKQIDQKNNFIYEKISRRIVDSLDLINHNFSKILEIGINESQIYEYLLNKFPKSEFTKADIFPKDNISNNFKYIKVDFDKLKLSNNLFDLIYSNFIIHLSNDLERTLKIIYSSMKSNGFFIASIPHVENCYQLVNSMYETDQEIYMGVYQRINPTIEIENILSILKKIGFDIPTLNTDSFIIEYKDFENLLKDLKSTKLSYCYNDKRNRFENKNYFNRLMKIYEKNYFNGNYLLEIKFNIISAWKK